MKTTGKPTAKVHDNGSVQQARKAGDPRSAPGGDTIPREQLIAVAAYFRAERRGFVPGYEMSDWLDAETDLERMMSERTIKENIP